MRASLETPQNPVVHDVAQQNYSVLPGIFGIFGQGNKSTRDTEQNNEDVTICLHALLIR